MGIDITIKQFEENGFTIVESRSVAVDIGKFHTPRFYDFLAYDPFSGVIVGVEVKTTLYDSIRLNPIQVDKDVEVLRNGGTVRKSGQLVRGVAYRAVCFGCDLAVKVRTNRLFNALKDAEISFDEAISSGVYQRKN